MIFFNKCSGAPKSENLNILFFNYWDFVIVGDTRLLLFLLLLDLVLLYVFSNNGEDLRDEFVRVGRGSSRMIAATSAVWL